MSTSVDSGVEPRPRLLLVDDDEDFRESLARLLREHGQACDTAGQVESAESMLRQIEYAAVVCDLRMPGNTKCEFLERLCSRPAAVPVIVLTGHADLESAIHSVNLHVSSYLEKPVTVGQLLPHIERALELTRARRAVSDLEARLHAAGEAAEQMKSMLASEAGARPDRDALGPLRRRTARELLEGLLDLEDLREQIGEPAEPGGPDRIAPGVDLDPLSPREREVLQFIARGYRVPTISAQLEISRHTVRNHLKRIFAKLGVSSQAQLLELIKPV